MWLLAKQSEFLGKIFAVATIFFLPFSTSLTSISFILAVLFYYAGGNIKQKITLLKQNQVAWIMLAFFALFVLGIAYSIAPFKVAVAMALKYDRFLFGVLLMPLFAEEKWRKYAINSFLAAAIILMIFSFIKYFGHLNYDAQRGPAELFKNHIDFNFMLGIAAYLIMLKFSTEKIWGKKIVYLVLLFLMAYDILFLCVGRSGYFTFAILIILFFIQLFKSKGLVIALAILPLIFFAALINSDHFRWYSASIVADMSSYQVNQVTSVGERFTFGRNSLKLILTRPVVGYGTGSFKVAYAKLQPAPAVLTNNPHNEYMHIGVQFGVVGIFMMLLMFGSQLWHSRKLPDELKFIAQAVVIVIAIGCLANSWLLDSVEGNLYVYFMALTFGALVV